MVEPSGRAVVERFAKAIQDKDFDAQAALIADDYVEEMPQSGERVRGRANRDAVVRGYPGGVGTVDADSLAAGRRRGQVGADADVRASANRRIG